MNVYAEIEPVGRVGRHRGERQFRDARELSVVRTRSDEIDSDSGNPVERRQHLNGELSRIETAQSVVDEGADQALHPVK